MAHDPFDLDAQEAAQQTAEEKAKHALRVEKEDLLWLMQNKRGRRVMHRELAKAGVWRLSFNTNAMQMAFNEGNRNRGLELVNKLMGYCPESFTLMLQENQE